MQHRYVGDIGDYVKLGFLRALSPGLKAGVAWWLYPDESHNGDGRHIGYLQKPEEWRSLDPGLFDDLNRMVSEQRRLVSSLEDILRGVVFSGDIFPHAKTPQLQEEARRAWFESVKEKLREADFVFVDPDNGIQTPRFSARQRKAGKSISFAELQALGEGKRPLLIYHHQTRRKGGHLAEIKHLAGLLKDSGFCRIDALRAHRYSPRVFFLLNSSSVIRERAREFSENWAGAVTWHSDCDQ